jgi:Fe-S-cluster formation regulator IscX/YfhJ
MASYPAKVIADEIHHHEVTSNPLFTEDERMFASDEIIDTWILSRCRFINNDDCKFIPFNMIETLASNGRDTESHKAVRNLLEIPTDSYDEDPEVFSKTVVFTVIHWRVEEVQEFYDESDKDKACALQAIIAMNDESSTSIIIQDKNEYYLQDNLDLNAVSGYNGLLVAAVNKTWNLTSRAFGWRRVETEVDATMEVGPVFARRECISGKVGLSAVSGCSHSIPILYIAGRALEYGIDFDHTSSCLKLRSHGRPQLPCLHAFQREMFISSWNHIRGVFQNHHGGTSHVYDGVYQLAYDTIRPSFPSKSFRPQKRTFRRLEEHIRSTMEACRSCVKQQCTESFRLSMDEDEGFGGAALSSPYNWKEQLSELKTPSMPTDNIKRPNVPSLNSIMKALERQRNEQFHQATDAMEVDTAKNESLENDSADSDSEREELELLGVDRFDDLSNNDDDDDDMSKERLLANNNPHLNSAGYLSLSTGEYNMEEINRVVLPDQGWRLDEHWFKGFLTDYPQYVKEHLVSPGRPRKEFLYQARGDLDETLELVTLSQLNSLPPRASATGHHNGVDLRLDIEKDGPIAEALTDINSFDISGDIDSLIHVGPNIVIDTEHGMPLNTSPTYSRRIPFQSKNYVNVRLVSSEGESREFDLSEIPFAVISKLGSSKAPAWVYIGFPQLVSKRPDRAGRNHYNGSLGNPALHMFWNNVLLPSLRQVSDPIIRQLLPQDISHSTIRRGKTQNISAHILPGTKIREFTDTMRQIVSK